MNQPQPSRLAGPGSNQHQPSGPVGPSFNHSQPSGPQPSGLAGPGSNQHQPSGPIGPSLNQSQPFGSAGSQSHGPPICLFACQVHCLRRRENLDAGPRNNHGYGESWKFTRSKNPYGPQRKVGKFF